MRCKVCKEEKDESKFYKHPNMHNGRFATCKECMKKKQREEYQKKKGDMIERGEWV